jgi:hypothetical protein
MNFIFTLENTKNYNMKTVFEEFVEDLHAHMIKHDLKKVLPAALFNAKINPLAFDALLYPSIEKPYMRHLRLTGRDLFNIEQDSNGEFLVSPIPKGTIRTLYPGRNIQVTLSKSSKSSIEKLLSPLNQYYSGGVVSSDTSSAVVGAGAGAGAGARAGAGAGASSSEDRKRPRETDELPPVKKHEPEIPLNEIDHAISMLRQIQALERSVAENQAIKSDLTAKIAKQEAQLKALDSL